eukprot:scaffold12.g8187.t1
MAPRAALALALLALLASSALAAGNRRMLQAPAPAPSSAVDAAAGDVATVLSTVGQHLFKGELASAAASARADWSAAQQAQLKELQDALKAFAEEHSPSRQLRDWLAAREAARGKAATQAMNLSFDADPCLTVLLISWFLWRYLLFRASSQGSICLSVTPGQWKPREWQG